MRASLRFIAVTAAVLALLVAGCATQPEPQPEEEVAEPAAPEPQPEVRPEPTEEPQAAPEPEQPSLMAAFVGSDGERLPNGATVTLPTGAPPDGRIYLWSSDAGALGYVTRDGSLPTRENYWVGEIQIDGSRPLSSTVETSRVYRLVAVSDDLESPVATLRVNWQHEESPDLAAPEFVVQDEPVAGSITMPVGGAEAPDGRLYVRSSYLGATIYVTNDGVDPTPEQYWRSGLSDGLYIYATDEFSTTYKAIAVLRGSVSPISSLTVEWGE